MASNSDAGRCVDTDTAGAQLTSTRSHRHARSLASAPRTTHSATGVIDTYQCSGGRRFLAFSNLHLVVNRMSCFSFGHSLYHNAHGIRLICFNTLHAYIVLLFWKIPTFPRLWSKQNPASVQATMPSQENFCLALLLTSYSVGTACIPCTVCLFI